jgi:hypothetical protein
MTIIGLIGNYGTGAQGDLGDWWDLGVVVVFSLVIFYYAVSLAMTPEQIRDAVKSEERAIEDAPDLRTA